MSTLEMRRRPWATAAAGVGFAMVVIYVTLIVSEGNNDFGDIAPWVLTMAAAATLSLVAANVEAGQKARTLLLASGVLFLAIGVISLSSVGVGFLAAGVMALFAAFRLPRSG